MNQNARALSRPFALFLAGFLALVVLAFALLAMASSLIGELLVLFDGFIG